MELIGYSHGSLCEMEKFQINGKKATWKDFGEKYDRCPDKAEDYGCGDMQFTRIDPTEEVLTKYGITETEYADICERLESELSFGCCGWCV